MQALTKEKTMTVKEVAEVLQCSSETVRRTILKMFPNKMENGKTTYLNEKEVTAIKLELDKTLNLHTDVEVIPKTKLEKQMIIQQALIYQQEFIAELQAENEKQKQQLLEQAPKVEMYDISMYAENTYSMNEVAKILKLPYGNRTLFNFLRTNRILDKNNVPYEKFIKQDLFKVVIKPVRIGNKIENKTVTRVTQKGADYILKALKKEIQ